MSYLKLGGALIVFATLLWLAKTVNDWREGAADRDRVQQEYATYRLQVARETEQREREQRVDREVIDRYIAERQTRDQDLAAARTELRNVRLRLAPAAVRAAGCTRAAVSGTDDPGGNGQPPMVEGAGAGIDAEGVAERFAACDNVGIRLNALIERAGRLATERSR